MTVMPGLVVDSKTRSLRKVGNRIPAHGIHRYVKAGSGSDLLNLRNYQIGDPPKQIAWKITARRDQLTTKDYESEVPIRSTIFIDHSGSVRLGWPGATPLEESVQIASTLIRRLMDHHDPVGLCLLDGEKSMLIPPAPGRRQETRLLRDYATWPWNRRDQHTAQPIISSNRFIARAKNSIRNCFTPESIAVFVCMNGESAGGRCSRFCPFSSGSSALCRQSPCKNLGVSGPPLPQESLERFFQSSS